MKLYQKYLNDYKNGLIGYSAIAIIGQSCLGSVAVMFILMNGLSMIQLIQLFLVTAFCMVYNANILSQQKARISFNVLIMSVLVSVILIVINLILLS